MRDLFDSLYRGYPVGTLLFWETDLETSTKAIEPSVVNGLPQRLIIDGQQRLTSLYAVLARRPVLTDDLRETLIQIAFRPHDETFEVSDTVTQRSPEFLPDITQLWTSGYRSVIRDFLKNLAEHRGTSLVEDERDRLEDRIYQLRDIQDFPLQALELNSTTTEEQAAEIFVRINYQGVQLKQLDFILTLMSVYWEDGRQDLESFCHEAVTTPPHTRSSSNPFIDPSPDQLLRVAVGLAFRRGRLQQVYNILKGKDLRTGQFSNERRAFQFGVLRRAQEKVLALDNWNGFLKCLPEAGFLSRRMITSNSALLFSYIIWLIGRYNFDVDAETLRVVVARWFFMAHTTSRYSGSTDTQLEADLSLISTIKSNDPTEFCSVLDRTVRSNFTSDYWEVSLPNLLGSSSSRSPALRAYWAALNLLEAEHLFSDKPVRDTFESYNSEDAAPATRLWSRASLSRSGESGSSHNHNAVANLAFIDWPRDIHVEYGDPTDYWPTLTRHLGEDELSMWRYWHALPLGWERIDYRSLLEQRCRLMAQVVRDGYDKLWQDRFSSRQPTTLQDFLSVGESQKVEYKSTATVNLRTDRRDKRIEHSVTKTVCGFMNAIGGVLLIGVDDRGHVLGLDTDMKELNKDSRDQYELVIRSILDSKLSIPTVGIVKIEFDQYEGRDVCMVSVGASGRAVFTVPPVKSAHDPIEFWVRVGNMTKQLHGDDMMSYMSDRWG